jgi:nitrite reductase/ring-hydroxylating ferredoxin subunit
LIKIAARLSVTMTSSGQKMRRLFLKTAPALLAAPALWLMDSLAKRAGVLPENSGTLLTIPMAAGNGIRFYDKVIVIASAEGVTVLSSVCTHLGCHINRAEGGELVCPCHGSRFNARGELLRGPAGRNLRPLPFELDRVGAVLRIMLNNEQARTR